MSFFPANLTNMYQFSSVIHVQLFATPLTVARQASLSITNSQSLLKLMSIESVMPFNHLILCCPLLLLPSICPSIRVFSNVSPSHQVVKILELQLQHQSFQWISELISFRMDWLDLLAVQGTLKSLLQQEMGISDRLTCLLRNLYACQEATVRTGHGTTD